MGVIFEGGVVGRINEVGRRSAEVQLLTHPNFRMQLDSKMMTDLLPSRGGICRVGKLRVWYGCTTRPPCEQKETTYAGHIISGC